MLPDLSNKIKTLAGTSAVPDPGGKAFEYEFEIIKQVNKNTLTINILICFIFIWVSTHLH